MLKEIKSVKQIPGQNIHRWFRDEYFDLTVFCDSKKEINGFELCYNLVKDEHVLNWHKDKGFSHNKIDDGESSPLSNMTPIHVPDGIFPFDEVMQRFKQNSGEIDKKVVKFVAGKLKECPSNIS